MGTRSAAAGKRLVKRGIAVLALQGDFAAHGRRLGQMGLDSFEARKPEELEGASGLVVPGGESTTLWKFFESAPWEDAIRRFAGDEPERARYYPEDRDFLLFLEPTVTHYMVAASLP